MPLSYSQLAQYRRCPKQYEFAAVKKIPRGPISAPESFGSSVHNTLKKWGELELGDRELGVGGRDQLTLFTNTDQSPASRPLSLDTLLSLWHASFIVEGYVSRTEADAARDRGGRLMRQFYDWWQVWPRCVIAIEKSFSVELDGMQLKGRFDRVERTEQGIVIIDYKTSAVRPQRDVDHDFQLSVYAIACEHIFGEPCHELFLLFLDEEGVTERITRRTPVELDEAAVQILSVQERIDAGDYLATPSVAVCRHCPYRTVCNFSAAS